MRLYHYMKADHLATTLESGHLKVATIADLNDPFELLALSFLSREERTVQRRVKEYLHSKVGLICFSETWREPVMWSHYGDRHRGVVLAFDVSDVHKVNYTNERLRHKLDMEQRPLGRQFLPLLGPMMTTKSLAWAYEREFRKFVFADKWTMKPIQGREGEVPFYDFRTDMKLARVILGPDCVLRQKDVSASMAVGGLSAPVVKARRAFQTFTIVLPKSPPKTGKVLRKHAGG
jgi:hypothetical protein